MPRKIERLTEAQIARFPEFVAKWTEIGLCTDPADRPRAERGIVAAYKITGLEPPKQIVWCGSPLSQGLTRATVFGLGKTDVKVRASVEASVRASVGASVWASVGASVWASVGASVGASVRASVRDSVWASVRASVGASVRDSVGASVRDSVYGQHEAGWLSFHDYFALACGLSAETQKLCGLWDVAQSAGWWLPHQNICWVSERHNILNRDERGRLHCENGPAIAYPDGWSIYAMHGVRIDEQIVMRPETQTVDQIRAEPNAEVKRLRIERFGWPAYLDKIGATVLDLRENAIEATTESLMRTPNGETVLVCACCSTGRIYSLEVPPETESCENAQHFLSGGLAGRIINAA